MQITIWITNFSIQVLDRIGGSKITQNQIGKVMSLKRNAGKCPYFHHKFRKEKRLLRVLSPSCGKKHTHDLLSDLYNFILILPFLAHMKQ